MCGRPSGPTIAVDDPYNMYFIAAMTRTGLLESDGDRFTQLGFLRTGRETDGVYPSRDARQMYVSNRGGRGYDHGSVSVVDFTSRSVVAAWPIPHPSTPDM